VSKNSKIVAILVSEDLPNSLFSFYLKGDYSYLKGLVKCSSSNFSKEEAEMSKNGQKMIAFYKLTLAENEYLQFLEQFSQNKLKKCS
jgi:thiaminase